MSTGVWKMIVWYAFHFVCLFFLWRDVQNMQGQFWWSSAGELQRRSWHRDTPADCCRCWSHGRHWAHWDHRRGFRESQIPGSRELSTGPKYLKKCDLLALTAVIICVFNFLGGPIASSRCPTFCVCVLCAGRYSIQFFCTVEFLCKLDVRSAWSEVTGSTAAPFGTGGWKKLG